MSLATAANVSTKAILSVCNERGIESESLLKAAGIDPALLANGNSRIPVAQISTLWHEAEQRTGDQLLGLRASQRLPFGANKIIDYLLMASATAQEGFTRLTRYHSLLNSAAEFCVRAQREQLVVELHDSTGRQTLCRPYVEYITANGVLRLSMTTGRKIMPREVRFTHAPAASDREYHRLFQSVVRFNQPINQLIFNKEDLDQPQPHADPALCEILESHALRLLSAPAAPALLAELARDLREALPQGILNVTASARRMALSRRTLQRKLKEQGTSYRAVLDEVRRELAIGLMAERARGINEIAFLLGFAEPTSFYRAFKRWTGQTPQEYLTTETQR